MRVALLGPGSSNGAKKPEARLIELPETLVRQDIDINLLEALVNSIDNMEPNAMIKAIQEFNSKALILGHKVGSLFQKELREGNRLKKAAWEKERQEWLEEKKRLGTWKVWCLESEKKLKAKIVDLEVDYDELKEKT